MSDQWDWDVILKKDFEGASPEMVQLLDTVRDKSPCQHEWVHRNDHGEDSEDGFLLSCQECGIHLEDVNEAEEAMQMRRYIANTGSIYLPGILVKAAVHLLKADNTEENDKLRKELAELIKGNSEI